MLLPIFGWLSVTKVIPKFAEQIAESIPEAYIVELSQNALARFDEYTFEPSMIPETKQTEIKGLMNLLSSNGEKTKNQNILSNRDMH